MLTLTKYAFLILALVLAILALNFGRSKVILTGSQNVSLAFYRYTIAESDITAEFPSNVLARITPTSAETTLMQNTGLIMQYKIDYTAANLVDVGWTAYDSNNQPAILDDCTIYCRYYGAASTSGGVAFTGPETTKEIKLPKIKTLDGTTLILTEAGTNDTTDAYAKASDYYGEAIDYQGNTSDTKTYRLFYVDFDNKYKDGQGTIYLKADWTVHDTNVSDHANYTTTDIKDLNVITNMNQKWKEAVDANNNNLIDTSEFTSNNANMASWLCSPSQWTNYANVGNNKTGEISYEYLPSGINENYEINYAIGGPSIEMYVDSYNESFNENLATRFNNTDFTYSGYQFSKDNGSTFSTYINDLNNGKNRMYFTPIQGNYHWWLSSPHAHSAACMVCRVNGASLVLSGDAGEELGICPLVSIKPGMISSVNVYKVIANADGGTVQDTTGWIVDSGNEYATKFVKQSTYGTLPTPTKEGYTFDGWYNTTKPLSKSSGTLSTSTQDKYANFSVLDTVVPNTTYYLKMNSAIRNSGDNTEFMTYIYNLTTDSTITRVGQSFGNNISYNITCPSNISTTDDIRILIYYGIPGQEAGMNVDFNNIVISTEDTNSQLQYTENTVVSTTGNNSMFARWTPNNYEELNVTTHVKYYETLAQATAGATSGNTIKPLTDTTEATAPTLATGKTVTLDLNGKTVTLNGRSLTNNGTLNIVDNESEKATPAGVGTISSTTTAIINNGTLTIGNNSTDLITTAPKIEGTTYGIQTTGTFNFYDGVIVGKNGTGSATNNEPNNIPQGCETHINLDGQTETLTLNKEAIFDTGENVNLKIKKLVNSSVTARTEVDTSIKSIQHYTGTMDDNNKTADNKVSAPDSEEDIYMWYDNSNNEGILYWWSKDATPKLNADASYMFYRFNALNDISGVSTWDTSSTESMYGLFAKSSTTAKVSPTNVEALANWDVSNVTNLTAMFQYWVNLQNVNALSNWDTSSVTIMQNMFYGCSALTDISGLTNWDTSSVTIMQSLFNRCSALTDISGLTNWDTSSVTTMQYMFYGCTNLTTIDISGWDTSSVTVMKGMFEGCTNLETIYVEDGWSTAGITTAANGADMFSGDSKLVGGAGTACDGTNNITYTYACIDQGPSSASPGYFTGTTALLTYNANGHGTAPANVTMTKTSATNAEDVYTAEGYLLTGWNTKADGSGTAYAPGAVVKAANTLPSYMTLYAQWMGPVLLYYAYEPYLKEGTSDKIILCIKVETDTSKYTIVKTGFVYYTGEGEPSKELTIENVDSELGIKIVGKAQETYSPTLTDSGNGAYIRAYTIIKDNVTQIEAVKYLDTRYVSAAELAKKTLTYDANGHGTAPANVTMTYADATNAAAALTETGYIFTGWNTEADGTGTAYAAGAEVKAANTLPTEMTLYAQWIPETSTITINKNNAAWSGSGMKIDLSTNNSSNTATFTQTVSSGSEAVFENLVSGTTYYIYAGKHSSAKKTMVNTGLTIVAGESKTVDYYTISRSQGTGTTLTTRYDSSSGSSLSSGTNVLKGVTIYAKATINSGYHGTVTLKHHITSMTASGGTFTVSKDEIIESAGATANTYTIVFNKNASDASGTMSNLAMTYGTATKLTANAFTRSGYTFVGWAKSSTGSVVYTDRQSVKNLTTTNNGTVNLYAKWEKMPIGASVDYSTTLNGVTLDKWKVFYNETKNGVDYTYIILEDYLPNAAVSSTVRTTHNLANGDGIYSIKSAKNRGNLLNAMTTKSNWDELLTGTLNGTTQVNQTRTANVWAMGAPTLELWVNSWNAKYPSDTLYTKYENPVSGKTFDGWYIGNTGNPTTKSINLSSKTGYGNTLYYPHQAAEQSCYGYWLASPSAYGTNRVMRVRYDGSVGSNDYNITIFGFRPVVCLPSSVLE